MEIIFKIYSIAEEWIEIEGEIQLKTTLTDWGGEYKTEEDAVEYLKTAQLNGDEVTILKIYK